MKTTPSTRASQFLVLLLVLAGAVLSAPGRAEADPVYGTQSIAYSGVSNPPTSDKPQSKLWFNAGSWWADMWTTGTGWNIYRLDRSTETWVNTGIVNDTRANTLADVLWDGSKLYIASHVVTVTGDGTPNPSQSGQPAKLYRYSYSGGSYALDPGFPTTVTNNSSESMTIDQDSLGGIWATWTQVAGNSTSGYTNTVYVNHSADAGATWDAPFVLPVASPHPAPDDISAVVAFNHNQIGVMWSDHLANTVWWATHPDGKAADSNWQLQPAMRGKGQADDHLNLKSLQSDTAGRVFAAVKTSLNDYSPDPTVPQLVLLVFKPGTAAFTQSTISVAGDCVTRPQILLDTQNNMVHAFQTAPPTSVTGCSYSGAAGAIYEKTASMDNPVFGSGRGTPIIQSASSSNMNNATTTKQSVDSSTGLVVLASDHVAKRYWFSDRPLGTATPPPAAPAASFTATPTSGTAPLDVVFTDTSTGSPTSWSWAFGDGGTSTVQNPTHSYAAAGTYTATLTAGNSTGSSTASATITVSATTPPPATGGITVVNSSTTYSGTATLTAPLPVPAGTAAGDVLVASVAADLNPAMTPPAGWTPIVSGLSVSTGARLFSYYHVVGASDPASYTWTFNTSVKWGGGITAYRGVNNATPLDSTVATATDTSWTKSSLTVGSITTATNGAMQISTIICDCASPVFSPPSGWIQRWQSAGGQIADQADVLQATAGATGTATWTFSAIRGAAAWRTALKPAG